MISHDIALPTLIKECALPVQYKLRTPSYRWGVELIVLFDHDWQHHALVQIWDGHTSNPEWKYSLWFYGEDSADFELVKEFDAEFGYPPYVEAATIVQDWRLGI